MYKTVIVEWLNNKRGRYTFTITTVDTGFEISIPGHGGGIDGHRSPDDPEQEQWMKDHSGLPEIWYLTWKCENEEELEAFLTKLQA